MQRLRRKWSQGFGAAPAERSNQFQRPKNRAAHSREDLGLVNACVADFRVTPSLGFLGVLCP